MHSTQRHRPDATADDPQFGRIAALLIGTGAFGVIVTSVCYALAGADAAMPGGSTSVDAARAATAAASGWMRAAGLAGMPSDVLLAVGALMMAATQRGPGAAVAVAGWLALAIAGALFIVVDAMVAMVLPPLALLPGAEAYSGLRSLFEVLFAIGAWAAGAGALAAAWSARGPEYRWPAALWLMRAAGIIGLLANTAFLLGLPGARLIGIGVAVLALALLALSLSVYSASRARIAPITAL